MNKSKILYITPMDQGDRGRCGVSLVGTMIGKVLETHPIYNIEVLHTDDPFTAMAKIKQFQPEVIVFNHHERASTWMAHLRLKELMPKIKSLRIVHDSYQGIADSWNPNTHPTWDYLIFFDPTIKGNSHCFITNRVIPNGPTISYVENKIPIIGWQGFPGPQKGLHKIAQTVQNEFDEAIIRFHIPEAFFAYDPPIPNYNKADHHRVRERLSEVYSVIHKPGIKVEVTQDWMNDQDVVNWLSQNTINCYFYDYQDGSGLSSSLDYALAARRPIAVTKSHQMRHFWNLEPTVLIEESSLKKIIENGTSPLEDFYKNYTKEQVWQDYTAIFEKIGL